FDQTLFSQAVDSLGNWVRSWPVDRSIDEPGKVNLLTMHKAKGLEAPVVMLGMTSQPKFHEPSVMLARTGQGADRVARGLLKLSYSFGPFYSHDFALSPGWKNHVADEEAATLAEKLRLDYVACTRARDLLILSRHHNKSGGVTSPLFKELSPATDQCPEFVLDETEEQAAVVEIEPDGSELKSWVEHRRNWRSEKSTDNFDEQSVTSLTENAEKTFSARSGGGRAMGVFVHNLLCNLMRRKIKKASDPLIELMLDHQIEEEAAMKARRSQVLELVKNVLAAEIWGEALNSSEIHTEVPYQSRDDKKSQLPYLALNLEKPTFINGVIDLVYRLPDGWKIVDYKTNQIDSEAHRDELNRFYQGQLDLYARHWEKITGEKVCEKAILYVRDGREARL
ncbi:MAG: 3'-5' exonuclease, partial [Candidatus Riflebacteria bacterium]